MSISTVFVKPGPHELVLMPERNMTPLPADGALVELSPYWRARLRDGDVLEAAASNAESAAPSAKSAKR